MRVSVSCHTNNFVSSKSGITLLLLNWKSSFNYFMVTEKIICLELAKMKVKETNLWSWLNFFFSLRYSLSKFFVYNEGNLFINNNRTHDIFFSWSNEVDEWREQFRLIRSCVVGLLGSLDGWLIDFELTREDRWREDSLFRRILLSFQFARRLTSDDEKFELSITETSWWSVLQLSFGLMVIEILSSDHFCLSSFRDQQNFAGHCSAWSGWRTPEVTIFGIVLREPSWRLLFLFQLL